MNLLGIIIVALFVFFALPLACGYFKNEQKPFKENEDASENEETPVTWMKIERNTPLGDNIVAVETAAADNEQEDIQK